MNAPGGFGVAGDLGLERGAAAEPSTVGRTPRLAPPLQRRAAFAQGADGIDAMGRKLLALGGDIGGGKSDRAPELVAAHDLA